MKRSVMIITLILALSAGLIAQERPRRGPGRGQESLPAMVGEGRGYHLRALDLTEEQEAKIDALRLENQKEMIPLRTELAQIMADYRLMVIDEQASESDIEKNLNRQGDLRKKMKMARVKHLRDVRALLTDDQKTKFDTHFLNRGRGPGKGPRCEGGRMRMHRGL